MRYKYIVNFPDSQTPVATFNTMKAARAHSEKLVEDQLFDKQFFDTKVYLPMIKRQPILKGNKA
jgi:hypothetical protein